MSRTPHDLARAREEAAGDLEQQIAAVGAAYRDYQRTTQQLGEALGEDLSQRLELALVLHLAQAGLGTLLERKLTGRPAPLRALVEAQHARMKALGTGGSHD